MTVCISGVGMTWFGKRDEGLLDLMSEAGRRALEDSGGTDTGAVDALFVGSMNPEEFTGKGHIATALADRMELSGLPALRVETGMSTGAALFHAGFMAVASRVYKKVLLVGGEKMTHLPTADALAILSKVIPQEDRDIGGSMSELAAYVTRKYCEARGVDRDTLALVPVKNHANAQHNEYAQFRKPVTVEQVIGGRMVSDPLTIYDCAPISDGAAAVVLSTAGGVECAGIGHGTDTWSLHGRDSFTSFRATRLAAARAYGMAGCGPADIDVAELHDAFSAFEIIDTEDVGFFPPGEGALALRRGDTQLNGRIPVNPGGGLKARGHPIGASGLSQIIEIYWQLTHQAGKRQADGANTGLAQSIGGLASNNLVTILKRN